MGLLDRFGLGTENILKTCHSSFVKFQHLFFLLAAVFEYLSYSDADCIYGCNCVCISCLMAKMDWLFVVVVFFFFKNISIL